MVVPPRTSSMCSCSFPDWMSLMTSFGESGYFTTSEGDLCVSNTLYPSARISMSSLLARPSARELCR